MRTGSTFFSHPGKIESISASPCYQTSEIKTVPYKQRCYFRAPEYTICPLCPMFTFVNPPPSKWIWGKQFKQKFSAYYLLAQSYEVTTGVLEERESKNNQNIFSRPHISRLPWKHSNQQQNLN